MQHYCSIPGDWYRSVVVVNADGADSIALAVDTKSKYALQNRIFFTDDCPVKGMQRRTFSVHFWVQV